MLYYRSIPINTKQIFSYDSFPFRSVGVRVSASWQRIQTVDFCQLSVSFWNRHNGFSVLALSVAVDLWWELLKTFTVVAHIWFIGTDSKCTVGVPLEVICQPGIRQSHGTAWQSNAKITSLKRSHCCIHCLWYPKPWFLHNYYRWTDLCLKRVKHLYILLEKKCRHQQVIFCPEGLEFLPLIIYTDHHFLPMWHFHVLQIQWGI